VEDLVQTLGLSDRVRLPGTVPSRPNPHALFDISVLATHDEGSPNTLLEAMAACRPVVASAVGGVVDLVDNGVNGILTPARDSEALAEALLQLAQRPETRVQMGSEGAQRAARNHSAPVILSRLLDLYHTGLTPYNPTTTEPHASVA
jgi:glycosyltransferase involved in cell wall biosynthesis